MLEAGQTEDKDGGQSLLVHSDLSEAITSAYTLVNEAELHEGKKELSQALHCC